MTRPTRCVGCGCRADSRNPAGSDPTVRPVRHAVTIGRTRSSRQCTYVLFEWYDQVCLWRSGSTGTVPWSGGRRRPRRRRPTNCGSRGRWSGIRRTGRSGLRSSPSTSCCDRGLSTTPRCSWPSSGTGSALPRRAGVGPVPATPAGPPRAGIGGAGAGIGVGQRAGRFDPGPGVSDGLCRSRDRMLRRVPREGADHDHDRAFLVVAGG